MKRHHPGIFACALLNSQPMGFYAPAQIVRDAREHGVEVRPVCINRSHWDNVMERTETGDLALRLGFRQIKSMREEEADWIVAARGNGYRAVEDVWRRAGLEARTLTILAEADAFASARPDPARGALGRPRAGAEGGTAAVCRGPRRRGDRGAAVTLPRMTEGEEVVEDYVALRLTLRTHPVALIRHRLSPGIDRRWLKPREPEWHAS
jgi:DNA polymerase III alpha subunit